MNFLQRVWLEITDHAALWHERRGAITCLVAVLGRLTTTQIHAELRKIHTRPVYSVYRWHLMHLLSSLEKDGILFGFTVIDDGVRDRWWTLAIAEPQQVGVPADDEDTVDEEPDEPTLEERRQKLQADLAHLAELYRAACVAGESELVTDTLARQIADLQKKRDELADEEANQLADQAATVEMDRALAKLQLSHLEP